MQRLRLVFLVVAAVLLVPVVLLVERALASAAVEREVRHRAVAERAFDEMEGELTAWLRIEEERPVGHYRFYFVPEGRAAGKLAVTRSPLSRPPAEPWVLAYFEIDPDGSVHSPRVPRDPALATRSGDWRPTPEVERSAAELEGWVRSAFLAAAKPVRPQEPPPGATRRLEQRVGGAVALDEDLALREAEEGAGLGAYDALRALNRGAERASKMQKRSAVRSDAAAREAPAPYLARLAAPSRAGGAPASAAEPEVAAEVDDARGVFLDAEAVLQEEVPRRQRVDVEPFVGRAVDRNRWLLYRTVLVDGRGSRQGLAIDLERLGEHLDAIVLGGTALDAAAARSFFRPGEAPPAAGEGEPYVYAHRFGEPFDGLALQLALAPLPGVGSPAYLYALSGLLLVAGSLGLFALYRMVAVRVGFAERRSNFVAAVTHELKTPLTAIRMYGEMLRDGMVDSEEKRREYFSTITAESERLSRLIDNVLEFARLEQGTRELALTVGPIAPVVAEAARLLEPHARETGFALRVEAEPDLPPVRYDRDAVLQIVFNLVDNALKYARESGERVIDLRCARAGDGVSIAVRDRGPGVAPRQLARIFEPFYRAGDELTRRAVGTGIGLALVKGLAEHMGAAVAGRSPRDGGFEVSLTFEAAAAP